MAVRFRFLDRLLESLKGSIGYYELFEKIFGNVNQYDKRRFLSVRNGRHYVPQAILLSTVTDELDMSDDMSILWKPSIEPCRIEIYGKNNNGVFKFFTTKLEDYVDYGSEPLRIVLNTNLAYYRKPTVEELCDCYIVIDKIPTYNIGMKSGIFDINRYGQENGYEGGSFNTDIIPYAQGNTSVSRFIEECNNRNTKGLVRYKWGYGYGGSEYKIIRNYVNIGTCNGENVILNRPLLKNGDSILLDYKDTFSVILKLTKKDNDMTKVLGLERDRENGLPFWKGRRYVSYTLSIGSKSVDIEYSFPEEAESLSIAELNAQKINDAFADYNVSAVVLSDSTIKIYIDKYTTIRLQKKYDNKYISPEHTLVYAKDVNEYFNIDAEIDEDFSIPFSLTKDGVTKNYSINLSFDETNDSFKINDEDYTSTFISDNEGYVYTRNDYESMSLSIGDSNVNYFVPTKIGNMSLSIFDYDGVMLGNIMPVSYQSNRSIYIIDDDYTENDNGFMFWPNALTNEIYDMDGFVSKDKYSSNTKRDFENNKFYYNSIFRYTNNKNFGDNKCYVPKNWESFKSLFMLSKNTSQSNVKSFYSLAFRNYKKGYTFGNYTKRNRLKLEGDGSMSFYDRKYYMYITVENESGEESNKKYIISDDWYYGQGEKSINNYDGTVVGPSSMNKAYTVDDFSSFNATTNLSALKKTIEYALKDNFTENVPEIDILKSSSIDETDSFFVVDKNSNYLVKYKVRLYVNEGFSERLSLYLFGLNNHGSLYDTPFLGQMFKSTFSYKYIGEDGVEKSYTHTYYPAKQNTIKGSVGLFVVMSVEGETTNYFISSPTGSKYKVSQETVDAPSSYTGTDYVFYEYIESDGANVIEDTNVMDLDKITMPNMSFQFRTLTNDPKFRWMFGYGRRYTYNTSTEQGYKYNSYEQQKRSIFGVGIQNGATYVEICGVNKSIQSTNVLPETHSSRYVYKDSGLIYNESGKNEDIVCNIDFYVTTGGGIENPVYIGLKKRNGYFFTDGSFTKDFIDIYKYSSAGGEESNSFFEKDYDGILRFAKYVQPKPMDGIINSTSCGVLFGTSDSFLMYVNTYSRGCVGFDVEFTKVGSISSLLPIFYDERKPFVEISNFKPCMYLKNSSADTTEDEYKNMNGGSFELEESDYNELGIVSTDNHSIYFENGEILEDGFYTVIVRNNKYTWVDSYDSMNSYVGFSTSLSDDTKNYSKEKLSKFYKQFVPARCEFDDPELSNIEEDRSSSDISVDGGGAVTTTSVVIYDGMYAGTGEEEYTTILDGGNVGEEIIDVFDGMFAYTKEEEYNTTLEGN